MQHLLDDLNNENIYIESCITKLKKQFENNKLKIFINSGLDDQNENLRNLLFKCNVYLSNYEYNDSQSYFFHEINIVFNDELTLVIYYIDDSGYGYYSELSVYFNGYKCDDYEEGEIIFELKMKYLYDSLKINDNVTYDEFKRFIDLICDKCKNKFYILP